MTSQEKVRQKYPNAVARWVFDPPPMQREQAYIFVDEMVIGAGFTEKKAWDDAWTAMEDTESLGRQTG